MPDGTPQTIVAALTQQAAQPGATRDSLTRFLIDDHGVAADDARAIVQSVCDALLATRFPAITQIELMLTEDCNQRCDYCFVEGKNNRARMPRDVAMQAVDFLVEHARDKTELHILFFGGEPLLEFDLIQAIVAYANATAHAAGKQVRYSMTTNGTLLTEPVCRFLAEHAIPVLLSIDGQQADHDRHRHMADGTSSYERIRAHLPTLKRYQPWVGARMTVTPDTVDRLTANVEHLGDLGINQFLIGPVTGLDWSEAAIDDFQTGMITAIRWADTQTRQGKPRRIALLEEGLENFRKRRHLWGCRAGRHSVTVTSEGALFPCSKMLGVDGLKGIMPLGTLDEGITEIYNRLALCGRIPIERPACDACDLIDCCMGGCFATNYQETGSVFVSAAMDCQLRRAIIGIVEASREFLTDTPTAPTLVSDGRERVSDPTAETGFTGDARGLQS